MATYQQVSEWILSAFAHSISGGQALLDYLLRNHVVRIPFAADSAAGNTWTRYVYIADKAVNITSVRIVPDAALTVHETTYNTYSFATGIAGTMVSRDSFATNAAGSGSWVAATPEAFTVATATDSLTADQLLSVTKAVASTGTITPAHHIEIKFNYV